MSSTIALPHLDDGNESESLLSDVWAMVDAAENGHFSGTYTVSIDGTWYDVAADGAVSTKPRALTIEL